MAAVSVAFPPSGGASGPARAGASALGPYPGLGGCPVFPRPHRVSPTAPSLPNEAAWNQDVSRAPLHPRSRQIVGYINAHGGNFLHPDFGSPRAYGIPYAVVGARQRKLPIHFTAYGDESDPGPYPVPRDAPVEGGARSDGDRHVLVVDRSRCLLYELYRAFYRPRPRPHWNADSGAKWDLRSARRRPDGLTSADAGGLPVFAGLVRYDEIRRGRVKHALCVTFASTRDAWVHPASHCAGDTRDRDAPPMGLRLRLRGSYPLRRFSGAALIIARALKRFGLLVADNGSNWYFQGTSDHRWNDANLNQLKTIPGGAFQVVRSQAPVHRC